MLEKQRTFKKNYSNFANEYKMIKNTPDHEDLEHINISNKKNPEKNKNEILEMSKEINNEELYDENDTNDYEENIEEIKSAILNSKDEA